MAEIMKTDLHSLITEILHKTFLRLKILNLIKSKLKYNYFCKHKYQGKKYHNSSRD